MSAALINLPDVTSIGGLNQARYPRPDKFNNPDPIDAHAPPCLLYPFHLLNYDNEPEKSVWIRLPLHDSRQCHTYMGL